MVPVTAPGHANGRRDTLTNVQVLRFIAAAGVLTKHIIDLYLPADSPMFSIPWSGGVDLFFVISGFIMALITDGLFGVKHAARTFLLRRAIRIVPAYWFFTSLVVALLLVLPGLTHRTVLTLPQLVTSYAFIAWPRPADGMITPLLSQGWTLNYEAFFYICFAAALLLRRGVVWLAAGFALLVVANPAITDRFSIPAFYTDPIILEFLAGVGLHRVYRSGWRLPTWGSIACIVAAAITFAASEQLPEILWTRFAIVGVPAALLAAAFVLAPEPEHRGWLTSRLAAGGDASYALYLSHSLVVNAVFLLSAKFGLPPTLGMILAAAAAIAVAQIFYRMVEKPLTAHLYRLSEQRPVREAQFVAP